MPDLHDKVTLITGVGSGIGRATAIYFAKCGSSLAINDMNETTMHETADLCFKEGLKKDQVLCLPGNITENLVQDNLISKTVEHFGKLDVLLNIAGIVRPTSVTDVSSSMASFEEIHNLNVKTVYRLIHLATPHLKKTRGNIVNISSCISTRYAKTFLAYSISKGAVDQLTRAMAGELGPYQIRVNAVNPGVVDTNIFTSGGYTKAENDYFLNEFESKHALGRLGSTEEIAKPIAFLASDEASYITGAILPVSGGLLLNL